MVTFISTLQNLDLLTVGIAIAAIGILGFVVFFSNRKSITNKTLFFFSISAIFWNITNYLTLNLTVSEHILWNLRFHVFTVVWYCFFLFQLFYVFPEDKITFPRVYKIFLTPFVIFVAIITLTPLTFIDIAEISSAGTVSRVNNGPGIFLFGITVASLISGGLFMLLRKFRRVVEKQVRQQIQWVILGFTITFSLHIAFNFILPAFYDNPRFVGFGAVYTFPLIALTSFAILKHKLFNIKVAGTGLLVFALSIVAFGEVIFARGELFLIVYRSSIFALILIFGILLIKGVLREVEQREKIEVLAKDLEEANKAQENLIHFITHQVKGFLTKSKYIFAEFLEGTFGAISEDVKKMAKEGLKINTDGVDTVQDILNAANIKTGKMKYNLKLIDLKEIIEKAFEKHKRNAEEKGLAYDLEIAPGQTYGVEGDDIQLLEAFSNLIDNSIKYTLKGSITVSLNKAATSATDDTKHTTNITSLQTPVFKDVIVFSVKDTGVGIAKEDMDKIFAEGVRGKDALKVNVDSTGFGLYITKNIIEAHRGRVYAKSDGPGKGSEFIAELPGK